MKTHLRFTIVLLLSVLAACSETTTSQPAPDVTPEPPADDGYITVGSPLQNFTPVTAAVATVASDYTSGAHSIISGDETGEFVALNNLAPDSSDISIAAYGDSFYRIGRLFGGNNITRYRFDAPQTALWQFSVDDTGSAVSSNPYDIVFVSETKAYVLRYNSTRVWIVNPSAASEADFKLGEIDLSAYGGDDGVPDMGAAVIANGKLFIALQRLEGPTYQVVNDAYIAVIDIATDTEIDAGIPGDTLKGIPLQVRNPTDLVYQADSNTLFVQGSGSFFPQTYSGGIETINVDDYRATLVLDDSEQYGLITALQPVSAEVLYFAGYQDARNVSLYVMNIKTGRIAPTKVAALLQSQIADLALDKQGLLWVGDSAQASVRMIDPATGDEVSSVSTNLNPAKIVFAP